jgi:sRNA-binding protein
MTEITPELPTSASPAETESSTQTGTAPAAAKPKNRFASVAPVLEKLFELYPHLFGQRFLPLKLGVFQELLAAHPTEFKRDTLKAALGVHTRSTRYLQSVAAGNKRHDLQGLPVEDVAPEHVFLSIIELYHRRQARSKEDLTQKLRLQLVAAYDASGLSRQDYLARVPALDETLSAVLEDAIAEVDQQRARRAALVKAFEASGQSVEEFADALGMDVKQLRAALPQ